MDLVSNPSETLIGHVTIEGEFDNDQIGQSFETAINELISQGKKKIVIDLSKTETINSYGIGRIFYMDSKLKEMQGSLVLKGVHGFVREILDTIKISQLFIFEE
ncbi:MAG: STAS domain-containing protein [Proteobacteria bacterium]|nr:STAS domain-containing protein [Pseudomonadota bacterium]